jgi:hypothetical protein
MANVFAKLQEARIKLQATKLSKSGKNKFAGYEYFELADFLPAIQSICHEVGLCGVVRFSDKDASLTIYDTESEGLVVFTSPMSTAQLKGCHEVQNLGAVQTYLRRYLWTTAFEIVEHDALDATMDGKPVDKPAKPVEKPADKWQIVVEATDEPEWLDQAMSATQTALSMATSEADVMSIFKQNKELFDQVKTTDQGVWKSLMSLFSEAKKSFNKE